VIVQFQSCKANNILTILTTETVTDWGVLNDKIININGIPHRGMDGVGAMIKLIHHKILLLQPS